MKCDATDFVLQSQMIKNHLTDETIISPTVVSSYAQTFIYFSQGRTMDAVGLFLKSDSSETSPENDDVYFPDTISTLVPISHPQTLADFAEEELLKS